jgi:SAM-dependent methyltransferase
VLKSPKQQNWPIASIDIPIEFKELKVITCEHCGFSFSNEPISDESLRYYYENSYDGVAKKTANTLKWRPHGIYALNYRAMSEIAILQTFMTIKDNTKILEIGAGNGEFFNTLRSLSINSDNYAVEPQLDAHIGLRHLNINTIQDTFFSGFSDKYKLGNFDLVTSCHTIEHFNASDITNIFDEVKKMLKPGGIFFCEVPHANLHKFPDVNEVVNLHLSFFSINSIQNFVQKIGMEVIFCSTCGEKFSTKIAIPDVPKDDRERLYNEKFYLDSEEKVLINREHEVFHKKLKKKQDIKGLVVYLSSKIIGKKNTFKLLDLNQKRKLPVSTELLSNPYFLYGDDREYLRLIARKPLEE